MVGQGEGLQVPRFLPSFSLSPYVSLAEGVPASKRAVACSCNYPSWNSKGCRGAGCTPVPVYKQPAHFLVLDVPFGWGGVFSNTSVHGLTSISAII